MGQSHERQSEECTMKPLESPRFQELLVLLKSFPLDAEHVLPSLSKIIEHQAERNLGRVFGDLANGGKPLESHFHHAMDKVTQTRAFGDVVYPYFPPETENFIFHEREKGSKNVIAVAKGEQRVHAEYDLLLAFYEPAVEGIVIGIIESKKAGSSSDNTGTSAAKRIFKPIEELMEKYPHIKGYAFGVITALPCSEGLQEQVARVGGNVCSMGIQSVQYDAYAREVKKGIREKYDQLHTRRRAG